MKRSFSILIFLIVFLDYSYSDGPYFWGCVEWIFAFPVSFCKTEGYTPAPSELNFCSGETKSLWACIPGTCPDRTYSWHVSYLKEVLPGTYLNWSGPIFGANNNEYPIPEKSDSRTYWCEVTYSGNTTTTGSVLVHWNPNEADIHTNLSDEIVCLNDEVKLSFTVSGNNSYTWMVKPVGDNWSEIPDQNYGNYKFYSTMENSSDQYKCIASNSCWESSVESNTILLTVNDIPEADLGSDANICEGDSLTLGEDLQEMLTYNWSTGESNRIISVSNSGTYSVTVTNSNNCENSDEIIISVDPKITPLDIKDDQRICLNESVMLDAGPGYDNYLWNTLETSQAITINKTGDYWVEVSENNNICQERDTMHLTVAAPFSDEKICIVTIDKNTGRNMIVWEKTTGQGIQAYNIYRDLGIEPIGTVLFDELSVFTDSEVNPRSKPYIYQITAVDSCGNESERSPYHSPLFLQYVSSDGGTNLRWEKYILEEGAIDFSSYTLYRSVDSTDISPYITNIPTVASPVYTDLDRSQGYYYWIAGVLTTPCYPTGNTKAGTGPYYHAVSNMDDNKLRSSTGSVEQMSLEQLTIFPNPMNSSTTILFPNPAGESHKMVLTDLSGKVYRIVEDITTSEYVLKKGDLKEGLYFIELRGPMIYRGKIVIE
ncbi:T9SS type A sorting domain-containing protein [Bacteroidota bacterium]